MKRFLSIAIGFLSAIITISSCISDDDYVYREYDNSPDMIWDFYPINLTIIARSADKDYLNPQKEYNILNSISVTYNGMDYFYKPENIPTRYYFAKFTGLTIYSYDEKYLLHFGDFDGAKNYDKMKFVVNWPDGKKDEIIYSRFFEITSTKLRIGEKITLNGKKVNSLTINREMP